MNRKCNFLSLASNPLFHSEVECSVEAELCNSTVMRERIPWKMKFLFLTGSQDKIE